MRIILFAALLMLVVGCNQGDNKAVVAPENPAPLPSPEAIKNRLELSSELLTNAEKGSSEAQSPPPK